MAIERGTVMHDASRGIIFDMVKTSVGKNPNNNNNNNNNEYA